MPLLQMTLVVEDTILELRGKIQTAAVDDNIGFEVPERDILAGFDLVRLQLLNDLNAFFHTCLCITVQQICPAFLEAGAIDGLEPAFCQP